MAQTRRVMKENLGNVDLVFELLDARIPLSSRNPEILKILGDKKEVVILNKCDLADDKKTPTGKYSFKMVAEENADVNNFITEDASLTGDILSLSDEKNIFDPLVKKITESLKEQDIFNDKSAQPISKNIDGIACEIYWDSLVDDDFDYTTLQVDIPQFKYKEKNGSLYFYILQYSIKAIDKDGNKIEVMELVTVEGAIIYGNKRKFIYKDYDGKLKD